MGAVKDEWEIFGKGTAVGGGATGAISLLSVTSSPPHLDARIL